MDNPVVESSSAACATDSDSGENEEEQKEEDESNGGQAGSKRASTRDGADASLSKSQAKTQLVLRRSGRGGAALEKESVPTKDNGEKTKHITEGGCKEEEKMKESKRPRTLLERLSTNSTEIKPTEFDAPGWKARSEAFEEQNLILRACLDLYQRERKDPTGCEQQLLIQVSTHTFNAITLQSSYFF